MIEVIKCAVLIVIAVLCSAAAVCYYRYYSDKSKKNFFEVLKKDKAAVGIFAACYCAIAVVGYIFYTKKGYTYPELIEYLLLWNVMLLIAVIDYKQKKIPNKLVLFLIIERCIFIIAEIIKKPHDWKTTLLFSLIGMVAGGLIILACMLISRGGIGAGDMKLFAAIGLFFGLAGVLGVMMYSLFLAAIVSIVMLVSRKAKLKSTLPMAPFIFLGLNVYFVFA